MHRTFTIDVQAARHVLAKNLGELSGDIKLVLWNKKYHHSYERYEPEFRGTRECMNQRMHSKMLSASLKKENLACNTIAISEKTTLIIHACQPEVCIKGNLPAFQ